MKIYISHSSNFDYETELYKPLKNSLMPEHELILPHESSKDGVNSKDAIKNCDLVLAEVSYPSTGQGIEIGWADVYDKPIVCVHQESASPSSSLRFITKNLYPYKSLDDPSSLIKAVLAGIRENSIQS